MAYQMSQTHIQRGAPIAGVEVGVILLDTDIPRAVGDINHGRTFPFALQYEITDGAFARHVVEEEAEGLLERLVTSGQRLIRRGSRALTTSCGFLAIFQAELAEKLQAPVATSSLLQVPMLLRILPANQRLCVVAANATTLSERHLRSAGISAEDAQRVRIIGMEDSSHFYSVVVGLEGPLDTALARQEVVRICATAQQDDPSIGAFLFECTNLPPYSAAVREATGLPVWDATSLVCWLQGGFSTGQDWNM